MLHPRKLILASASPRRQELLMRLGVDFTVDPSDLPEKHPPDLSPENLAQFLATAKAKAVASKHLDAVVIAADTVGVLLGRVLRKPLTAADATAMLLTLSGRSHRVITGLAVVDSKSSKTVTRVVETRVFIRALGRREVLRYVATGEPLDKAGAYAIQGLGSVIVEKIIGDYYNVVGLPLFTLAGVLREFGIEIP